MTLFSHTDTQGNNIPTISKMFTIESRKNNIALGFLVQRQSLIITELALFAVRHIFPKECRFVGFDFRKKTKS